MLTSKDLLYKALDYDGFWNTSKRMKDSKPSKSRKAQLDKLFNGFGITKKNARVQSQVPREVNTNLTVRTVYSTSRNPKSMSRIEYIKTLTDFQYFTQGEFIADIDRAKYQNSIEQIISTTKTIFPERLKIIEKGPINLVRLFSNLYNFRLSVYHMFKYSFSQKMSEKFSIEDDYSLYLRKKFMESMANNLSEVDEVLCMLIDPGKRKLKEDEINYPHFDLKAIDEEWLNERRNKIFAR